MSDQCATCGAADALLFTCGYCDRAFCADHTLPNHSCEGLAHPGERATEESFEWAADRAATEDTAGHGESEDGFAASGFRPAAADTDAGTPAPRPRIHATPAVERVPRRPRDATPAVRPVPAAPDGRATPAVERVPPEPTPEPTAGAAAATPSTGAGQSVPIRPMDTEGSPGRVSRSDPRTLTEWLDQQTYVSLSVKTAALAAIINGALYLGMTLTMYGLTPV